MTTRPVPVEIPKDCETLLYQGLGSLGLPITETQVVALLAYLALLNKWNRAFNLTAIKEPKEMVGRHLLDSLSILPYLHGDRLIDVGTGAGLPGIPLSILSPDKHFILLDSNQKKQFFVSQAVKSLSLENVECVESNVETYQPTQKFSTILTRAFAPLEKLLPLSAHLLGQEGRFLAMMGKITPESLILVPGYQLEQVVTLKVPFEKGQRHVAIIKRDQRE